MAVSNNVILVGPAEMLRSLLFQAGNPSFWITILHSFGRISLGFLAAFAAGIAAGSLAYALPFIHELLDPLLSAVKSIRRTSRCSLPFWL